MSVLLHQSTKPATKPTRAEALRVSMREERLQTQLQELMTAAASVLNLACLLQSESMYRKLNGTDPDAPLPPVSATATGTRQDRAVRNR